MSMIISIIAPPGGGKTTILRAISEKWNVPLVSSGDIARNMQGDFLSKGQFAPEEEMRRRLKETVDKLFEVHPIVLADGFPRFVDQYEWMKSAFPNAHICLYYLPVPFEVVKERLKKRGRSDDDERTLQARIENYMKLTHPIVTEYNVPEYNYDFVVQSIVNYKNRVNRGGH